VAMRLAIEYRKPFEPLFKGQSRFIVCVAHRRAGKTVATLQRLVHSALTTDHPKARYGFLAPFHKQAKLIAWDYLKAMAREVPGAHTNESELRVDFETTGARVQLAGADNPDSLRGQYLNGAVLDEVAQMDPAAWGEVIRPALSDYEGWAVFIGTPKGRNLFHRLYNKAESEDGWTRLFMPASKTGIIPQSELDSARRDMTEGEYAQEYECVWDADVTGRVFRNVHRSIDHSLPVDISEVRAETDNRGYVIGVDWGRHNDYTVYTVIDAKSRSVIGIDRFTKIEYAMQLMRLKVLWQRFPYSHIIAEQNSMGEPLIEQLRRDGMPITGFQTTALSKGNAIMDLALAFEQCSIRIPNNEALVRELSLYDHERLPSGTIRYGAPDGEHDDCVMSLAIAWHGLDMGGRRAHVVGSRTF
jgi:hypothetical protein